MNKNKLNKKILAAVFVAAGILTGCGDGDVSTFQPSNPIITDTPATPSPTAEPTPTEVPGTSMGEGLLSGGETHTIGTRTVVDGKKQSYLTGEWKDASVVNRRNMAVMINNRKQGLPQYGISKASIIYEAPVEGRISRLMCYFEDYDDLDHIGTVRSSRDYFVYEATGLDSIYCNWGLAVPYVADLINSDRVDNISYPLEGIKVGSIEPFGRLQRGKSPVTGNDYSLEHTSYMFIDGYNKALAKRGYRTNYNQDFKGAFLFADAGYVATYDSYPDATRVYPGGKDFNSGGYGREGMNPCFTYNPTDRLYYRTQYGAEHIDEMTGEQLAVTNIVFKICHGEVRDANDYLIFGIHGSGDAVIFTNGKVIEGTWSRESDEVPNTYLDKNGNEIVLNQGKTWVCCIWKEFKEFMLWEK